jgi:hypothetical protein
VARSFFNTPKIEANVYSTVNHKYDTPPEALVKLNEMQMEMEKDIDEKLIHKTNIAGIELEFISLHKSFNGMQNYHEYRLVFSLQGKVISVNLTSDKKLDDWEVRTYGNEYIINFLTNSFRNFLIHEI